MKRVYLRTLLFTGGAMLIPAALYAASFQGPGSGCTPPNCNVPGVIWNMQGTGQTQTGAEVRVDGSVQQIYGDIYLQNTKAFRVDQNGSASFYVGNWYGGISRALGFYLNGDLYADRVNPYVGTGLEGRVQARKFCFYPGNPSDCITSWSSGGGLYVAKTGDAMTGRLTINTTTSTAIEARNSQVGEPAAVFQSTGFNGIGVVGNAVAPGTLGIGGRFSGREYGIYVTSSNGGGGAAGYFQGNNGIFVQPNTSNLGVGVNVGNYQTAVSAAGTLFGVMTRAVNANGIGLYSVADTTNSTGIVSVASNTTAIAGQFIHKTAPSSGTPTYPPQRPYNSEVELGRSDVGVYASGTVGGILGNGNGFGQYGVRGENGYYGGYGMLGYSNYGVYGRNTYYGGSFYGSTAGVRAQDEDTSSYAMLGYGNYSLYGNADVYTSGYGYFSDSMTTAGDLVAGNNALANCSWTAYEADGNAITCPSTAPLMSGFQRSGSNMRAYCCDI